MDTVDLAAGLKAATNDVDEAFEDPQGFQADGAGNCRIPDGQTLTPPRLQAPTVDPLIAFAPDGQTGDNLDGEMALGVIQKQR